MPRSLRVRRDCIEYAKHALPRQGYARQADLAGDLEISVTTVNNFLNGKPVDHSYFLELCQRLDLDMTAIAAFDSDVDLSADVPQGGSAAETEGSFSLAIDEEAFKTFYVERPPIETTCFKALLQPGALVRIKAPSHMGKTSLLNYVLLQLQQRDYKMALVNFHMAEATHLESLDAFLQWFCISVGRLLHQPNRLEDLWDSQFSTAKENCTHYFENHLLPDQGTPLVLCLDQVDCILTSPQIEIVREFFGLLRAWHEHAKVNKRWTAMRLVMLHSTEVYLQLRVNESPFNVGQAIELPEFTLEQIEQLADNHNVSLEDGALHQLFDLVGGHPYLLEQAFTYLKSHGQEALPALLESAPTEAGIYRNHLRQHLIALQNSPELVETFKHIVDANCSSIRVESSQAYQLYSRGLVNFQGNAVVIRCQLYQRYFASHFSLAT
ncbi:MAG: AAA-like domain-containing protein [Elainellaceae cyanobacterium]